MNVVKTKNMNLNELKNILKEVDQVNFELPNGKMVPAHFHVTEVGQINKRFIDCGGVLRTEKTINFQLWTAQDYDHRLSAEKLRKIITLSEDQLKIGNHEIEVEYQSDTIGKYGLGFNGWNFVLEAKQTDCLAKDNCGIAVEKEHKSLASLSKQESTACDPSSGCC